MKEKKFYKKNSSDRIFWLTKREKGGRYFSFDKVKIYSMFKDYPYALTEEERRIFDEENPYWKEFFKDRFE